MRVVDASQSQSGSGWGGYEDGNLDGIVLAVDCSRSKLSRDVATYVRR